MSFTLGSAVKITLFGASHEPYIGVMLEGLAPGIKIDFTKIDQNLARRRPIKDLSTARIEKDHYEVINGYYNNRTTGAPLVFLIENKEQKSQDYQKQANYMRPGHSDYSAYYKYKGFHDQRGGGFFSGRMTVGLVIAGAIAQQILEQKNIKIASKIIQLGEVEDIGFRSEEKLFDMQVELINDNVIPMVCPQKAKEGLDIIKEAQHKGDSVGAKMQTQVLNLEAGLGEPYFNGLDAKISHALFSIGSIKGVEFGSGFDLVNMKGSEANDQFTDDNHYPFSSNHAGGVLGGLSSGAPLVVNTMIKPTPSIYQSQKMLNIETNQVESHTITGRHDPAIFVRIGEVLNSCLALVLLDSLTLEHGIHWQRGDKNE